jgi:hypothetical protein
MEYKIRLTHMFNGKNYGVFETLAAANEKLEEVGVAHWYATAIIFEANAFADIIYNGRATILEGEHAESEIGALIEKLIEARDHEENMRDDVYDSEWC